MLLPYMSSRIVQNAHHKQCDVWFFFVVFFSSSLFARL